MAGRMYEVNHEFMYRIPTTNYEEEFSTEERLLQKCRDAQFREKLLIASPSLLQMVDSYLMDPDSLSQKKVREMFCSLEKYYRRSVERTTPFGLFAGVGFGEFGENNNFDNSNQKFVKVVQPDAGWLWEYIARLERQYYQKLRFKWNDVCINDGNRSLMLYTTTQDVEEISVRKTNALEVVQEHTKEYIFYEDIVNIVCKNYANVEKNTICRYIYDLIDKQILISDLRPSGNDREMLSFLAEKTKELDEELSNKLRELVGMCEQYEYTPIGEGESVYQNIVRFMRTLHESKYYLQIDTNILDTHVELDAQMKSRIENFAENLVLLSVKSQKQKESLNWYRDKFVEKYGFDRVVPLTEMLDTAIGIGAPIGYRNPSNDFFETPGSSVEIDKEIRNYFLKEYENAIKNHSVIKIQMNELKKYLHFDEQLEAPVSFELYMKLREENGRIRLYMSESGGSYCAGKTFGRFALKNNKCHDILMELNGREKEIRGNVNTCEIIFLPARLRNGNVMRCPSGRDKVLSAYMGTDNAKDFLSIHDILIGVDQNGFYALDGRIGQRVVFGSNNMYNLLLQPNMFRFLLEITNEKEVNGFEAPWKHIYQYFKHIPRIELDEVILSEEQWFLSLEDMKIDGAKADFEIFSERLLRYREEMELPDKLYLVEDDNRIMLDLRNQFSVRNLFDELKKQNGQSVLLERVEEGAEICYGNTRYASEFVFPMFRTKKTPEEGPRTEKEFVKRTSHIVQPYDNWLYFKLFCKNERQNELIALELKEFGQKLKMEMGITHFYMRYIEKRPHIRLRFYGDKQALYEATPDIMNWISGLMDMNIIGEMSINQYERETERYGGTGLIEYAEALFRKDSEISESILQIIRMQRTQLTEEDVTILSVIKYLEVFFEDFKDRLEFCTSYYHTNDYIAEFRKVKDKYLLLYDMENEWRGFRETEGCKEIYSLLEERCETLKQYKEKLFAEHISDAGKKDIFSSVLHLHCNRMIGTDREWERKIMAYVESLLYAKKHLYKERG